MKKHNPFEYILDELCNCNDIETEEALRASLKKSKEPVKELRNAYNKSPSNVDFSNEHFRAAYLLAYYPYYIDRMYKILNAIPEQKRNNIFANKKIRGCFFGAGPAPEVIGWINYLQCHYPNVKNAVAYIFDKNIHYWSKGLEITRYHLAPNYWDGILTLCQREVDLLQLCDSLDENLLQAIRKSNLFVMQNCINDLLHDNNSLCEGILEIFKQTEPGSLFIISDLNLYQVRNTVIKLKSLIENDGLGKCISHVYRDCVAHKPNIEVPSIIEEELFEETDGLIQKRKAHYCYIVLEKVYAEEGDTEFNLDDIPF